MECNKPTAQFIPVSLMILRLLLITDWIITSVVSFALFHDRQSTIVSMERINDPGQNESMIYLESQQSLTCVNLRRTELFK